MTTLKVSHIPTIAEAITIGRSRRGEVAIWEADMETPTLLLIFMIADVQKALDTDIAEAMIMRNAREIRRCVRRGIVSAVSARPQFKRPQIHTHTGFNQDKLCSKYGVW